MLRMIVEPPVGHRTAEELAQALGCRVAGSGSAFGWAQPALLGSTAGFSSLLRAAGGRYNRADRATVFPSWAAMERALRAALASRP